MKRFLLLFCLMVSALYAMPQGITVSFTGSTITGAYCPFDMVNVTNVTRGWTETLMYPDTVIVLSGLGVEDNTFVREGAVHVSPNPFMDFANVEFGIAESGIVEIRVIGVDGVQRASWEGYLQSGYHQVKITLDKPQMAFVVVATEKERYVGKMLHIGSGNGNTIDVSSASLSPSKSSKQVATSGDFMPGDMMSYEGVLLDDDAMIYSDKVTQEQFDDEMIVLSFPVAQPTVTVFEVNDITDTSAVIVCNVMDAGGLTVTERGVALNDPSNIVQTAGSGLGTFSVQLVGLTENTTYSVYAYAVNSLGTAFSEEMTFTTLADIPIIPVEVQTLPYIQEFISEFGTYTTYDVLGEQSWVIDYSTAKMTGYSNPSYYANEDWLISSPVAITDVEDAKMTMVYIGRYFSDINEDVSIWASNDYVFGNDPTMATWNQIPATLSGSSNWSDFLTAELSLTDYIGQTVTIAIKYTSTDSMAGTIEIQSITIEEGGGEEPPTPPTPGEGEGSGTAEDPYNVAAGISHQGEELVVWVHGYIVGAVKNGTTSVNSNDDVIWNAPFDSQTNVVIADDSTCNEISQCIFVNLPAGKPLREQVNLVDNPDNLGKHLAVQGILRSYYGKAGLRDSAGTVNDFVLEGGVTPIPPDPGAEAQTLPYTQSFATEFGTYMTYDVLGEQSWVIDYNTAKMTGYSNPDPYANEDWLISSPVALTDVEDVKMTMVYIGRYFNNINEEVTVWVSVDYTWGDDPTIATWTQLPANLSEGSNWNNFLTAELALTEFVGQTVIIAVKYISTDSIAGTIEIQSITIEEGSGEEPPTPPTPGEGEGSGTAEDPYNVAAGISHQDEELVAWVQGYIVGAVKSGQTSVSSNDDINWNGPFDLVTNVVIADDVTCNEISQCIIVNLPANKPLREKVNLVDNPDNLGKHLAVNGKLRRYFTQAGLRESGGTLADFVLEGMTPPTPGTGIFSETFASGQGDFTIQDVALSEGLSYVWQHLPSYSCMKASAYVSGQNHESESWLVSPAIDLSGVSDATLTFEQAVNYAAPQDALAMMISTNYNGDVTTATWNELNLDQWPAGNNWTFITSSADLSPYVGQQVTIAFKYTSSTSASATWEVKNFVVE